MSHLIIVVFNGAQQLYIVVHIDLSIPWLQGFHNLMTSKVWLWGSSIRDEDHGILISYYSLQDIESTLQLNLVSDDLSLLLYFLHMCEKEIYSSRLTRKFLDCGYLRDHTILLFLISIVGSIIFHLEALLVALTPHFCTKQFYKIQITLKIPQTKLGQRVIADSIRSCQHDLNCILINL